MTGPERQQVDVSQWQRPLLPAGLVDETPGRRRSPRDWVVDATMFALAVGLGGVAVAATWDEHARGLGVLDVLVGLVACMALWFRRRHPVRLAVVTLILSTFSAMAAGAAAAAAFNAALRAPRRSLPGIALLCVVTAAVSPAVYPGLGEGRGAPSYDWAGLIIGELITVIVLGWGLFARAQRDLVHSLHERAHRLEAERQLHAEQARDAERRRIAREMHDVLAHRVSLLSLHAGALEFRPDAPPAEIAEAAGVIRAAARDALQELREVIGVLRDDPDGLAPEPPQPTLAQIPALVEESRAAGMRVSCRLDAPGAAGMPAALGRTAYRVVQEGLTNARKHAPAAAVAVAVTGGDERLVVEVVSRRAVGVPVPARGGHDELLPGAGTGLIGLGERVALAGGALQHGPDAEGDFVLRATLPWPERAGTPAGGLGTA